MSPCPEVAAMRGGLRRRSSLLMVASAAVTGACVARPVPLASPPATTAVQPAQQISAWPTTLAAALRAAESDRYAEADRILLEFSVRNAGTAEGAESDYWRALLKVDPANRGVAGGEQLALLDAYLSSGPASRRYPEVLVLRRIVETMDSTRALLTAVRTSAGAREKAKDEEIRRLNDLYERTSTELERIRRRLVPVRP